MNRNEFVKTMAATVPAAAVVPDFSRLSETAPGKVRITDVKFMRIKIGNGHVLPLVKIETDAGIYGIGECHHDVTGLGAKDVVLNAFRQLLIKQDPFDIARLTDEMAGILFRWQWGNWYSCCYGMRNCPVGSCWKAA